MKTSRPCLDFHVPLLVSVILLALSLKVSSQRCLSSEFTCSDYRCIQQSSVCDGYNDCRDSSDENTAECIARRNKLLEKTIRKANGVASALTGGWIAVLAALLLVWFLILGLCCYIQICPLHKIYYGKLGPQPSSGNSGRGNP